MLPQTIFTAPRFASLANHVVGWKAQTGIALPSLHVYFDYILLHQGTWETTQISHILSESRKTGWWIGRTVHQRYGYVLAHMFSLALLQSWVFQNLQTALQIQWALRFLGNETGNHLVDMPCDKSLCSNKRSGCRWDEGRRETKPS